MYEKRQYPLNLLKVEIKDLNLEIINQQLVVLLVSLMM